jgi:hypothetical protein
MAKTFQRFGKDLSCFIKLSTGKKKIISLNLPKDYKKKSIVSRTTKDKDPFKTLAEK